MKRKQRKGSNAGLSHHLSPIYRGLAWFLYKCAALCVGLLIIHLQLKDLLEVFVKRREFLTGSGFLSRRDMT